MKAMRDVEADLYRFRTRVLAATILVGMAFALLLLRFSGIAVLLLLAAGLILSPTRPR